MKSPQALLPSVIALSVEAGRLLVEEFRRPQGPQRKAGRPTIDGLVKAVIHDGLRDLSGWMSSWDWVVDPHDGSTAFLAGERGTAISIALIRQGVSVLGVVHAPLSPEGGADTIAWAEGMDHLLRNGTPVASSLATATLAAGSIVFLPHDAVDRPLSHGRAVAPARFVAMPSVAYGLARVAAGDAVAAVALTSNQSGHYAAAQALLRAAGGILLDAAGCEVSLTPDGTSETRACFGGAPAAARELAMRDWRPIQQDLAQPRRIQMNWPRPAWGMVLDRARGCLFGQVAGDSLGSLVEFKSAAEIARRHPKGLRDLADGGTWSTIAGQPTDDSELALDLARTLAKLPEWSAEAIASAYAGWFQSDPFDIGSTTAQALSAAAAVSTGLADAARGAANRSSQANGALMRCAPIGLWARDATEAAIAAREDAALTHPHPSCQAASVAFVVAINIALSRGKVSAMLDAAEAAIPELAAEPVRRCLDRARRGEPPEDFLSQQGWVLIALQNAFRHLALHTPLEQAIIETVAQGGDTDTNAAICGALLGAAPGSEVVPMRWRMAILACRPIEELGALQPRPPRYWPDDLPALAEALIHRRG